MLIAVETIIQAMVFVVQVVPIGTNIGLLRIMWAMVNGSFLQSRGAVHGALSESGFAGAEIRQSWAALSGGAWHIAELLTSWQVQVASRNHWRERRYGGRRVKSIDITGFWRPRLTGQVSKHYHAAAQKALPAIVFGVISISGVSGQKRLPLLKAIVRCEATMSESEFRRELLLAAVKTAQPDEITVVDAGFTLTELQATGVQSFVIRLASNCTARRNELPARQAKGRPATYGATVRPLARTHKQKTLPATPADHEDTFVFSQRTIHCQMWHKLVTQATAVHAANPTYTIYVYRDPLYPKPWVLATDLALSAETVYLVYRDRWSRPGGTRHPPLAAKQMIGLHRQFVFAAEARFRLPELALLVGNILAHTAACLPPLPAGFWDRSPQATPGRLRRVLARAIFSALTAFDPELRKKNSVSDHLPKGVDAHRRHKLPA